MTRHFDQLTDAMGYLDLTTGAGSRGDLQEFASAHGFRLTATYEEVSSGKILRPSLFRVLNECPPGSVIIFDKAEPLAKIGSDEWFRLRSLIGEKAVRIIIADVPASLSLSPDPSQRTFVTELVLDIIDTVARKQWEETRRRATEGIAEARALGKFGGKQEDKDRLSRIENLLRSGHSWADVMTAAGCSKFTVAKVAKRIKMGAP